jgi:diacylglycerol kinase family enzyme
MPNDILPIVVNATAGTGHGDDLKNRLEAIFAAHGVRAQVFPAASGAELIELATRLASERPRAIVAGGGDGTLNAVASVLAGTDVALGVLPLGTLNHFAKDLGIPLDIDAAAQTIAAGHTISVDVGEVNGQVFINNSSLGLYPQIVRHRETQQRRLGRGKWPALAWASLMALRRSPFMTVRLSLDEVETRFVTTFVFIGNNEYVMEGFSIGKRERLDRGRLSLYVSHRRSRLGLIALGFRALFHRLHQADDFHALSSESIVVETRRSRLHVATDGEVTIMQTPLEYRIRPRALHVLVPPPESAAG